MGGWELCLEWRAASSRERAVIILRIEPAIGDQHLVRMHAPADGDRARPRERGGIDEAAEEKVIFGFGQRAGTRAQARKPPLEPAGLRHKQHGNAPSIFPSSICTFKKRRNILSRHFELRGSCAM
jgi:hypothetical protein